MKEPDSSRSKAKASSEYENFEALAKALISVPKDEIDKEAKEYERQKQKLKRKRPQSERP